MKDLWLPREFELSNGTITGSLTYYGEQWQIYKSHDGNTNILLIDSKLEKKLFHAGFLEESLFTKIQFGQQLYWSFVSPIEFQLVPVESAISADSKVDLMSFSVALKESRLVSDSDSFHDAIFIEQLSRLLPTWTLTPKVEDEIVLGSWMSGGVHISTQSFRRLKSLMSWLSAVDIAEIITAADLQIPDDVQFYDNGKAKTPPKGKSQEKNSKLADNLKQKENLFELPGRPYLEEFFNEHIVDIIFNAERYQALGIEFPSAVILHGPPGCGKTYAVERLIEFIDWPSYSIDSNSVGSPYIHETSKKISGVFDEAIAAAPSVLVIDEMESFLTDRQSGSSSGLHHVEEVAEFLRRIPEAIKNKVLIIAMTNLINLIDPAILRRGRFDHIIEVGMPSKMEVTSLIDSLLEKIPKSEDLKLDEIISALTGKPLSDSAFVIRESARLAAKSGKSFIDQESINLALASVPKKEEKTSRPIGFVWGK